ncbi:transposase [Streptomyces sp. NPDC101776]|uniref:transposase n=1 Tax=Streptomyces sp. NPDC101776 TaxID=3366146 RepID=UPI00380DAFBE
MPLARVAAGARTNEATRFRPLPAPLDLTGTAVTFGALHSFEADVSWPAETKRAHRIAVIKTHQLTAYAQLAALPRQSIAVQRTASGAGRGRRESRSIKMRGIAFLMPARPSASTAVTGRPAGVRPARVSTPAPASTPTGPARPSRP